MARPRRTGSPEIPRPLQGQDKPDIANLPAGEVYFVPVDARGQFPMKYEDGTLGVLDVENRSIIRSTLIEGDQATIDAHNPASPTIP